MPPDHSNFDVDSVKISDLGYSLDLGHGDRPRINEGAEAELPGTAQYMAPELLQARADRKKRLLKLINLAIDLAKREGRNADFKKLNSLKSNYDNKKLNDADTQVKLEELVGRQVLSSDAFKSSSDEANTVYQKSLSIVKQSPQKLDIFSCGITCWRLFNPDQREPYTDLRLNAPDSMRLTHLKSGKRPQTRREPEVHPKLFKKLVDADFFDDAWQMAPQERPTAEALIRLL